MIDELNLKGKRILVLGGSSGIGAQVCVQIAGLGGTAIVSGRNYERLNIVLKRCEGGSEKHSVIPADLSESVQLEELSNTVPPLDGLVYSAGIVQFNPIRFFDVHLAEQTFKINYLAAVHLTSLLVRKKKINPGCSLVFISSLASRYPFFGGSDYSGSKAALEMFSKTLAMELADKKIRSNVVAPAMVETALFERVRDNISESNMNKHLERLPLGPGNPKDVANLCCYLLSDAAKWITGMRYELDGGLSISAFK
ncbi:MAG: SDR family oxidoreductase [Flavobacteriales bacterium]|nr:SDR family oxidoreductase [Flavobacteriales bacterium]